ncbi:MAG: nitroreductase family protein [Thermoplasmata archaeon]
MDLESCILGRRSIRSFRPGHVPDEVILTGLRLASAAPSAGNTQEREFIIVRDRAQKERLMNAALGQESILESDVTVAFCGDLDMISSRYGKRGREFYIFQDVAAAVQNFLLYIHSQGLGAVWIGAFNDSEVSKVLGLPHHVIPIALVPVGKPGEVPRAPPRRELKEMLHLEKWPD